MGYIFFIAILNLGVGFALAWRLGRGYRPGVFSHAPDVSVDLFGPSVSVATTASVQNDELPDSIESIESVDSMESTEPPDESEPYRAEAVFDELPSIMEGEDPMQDADVAALLSEIQMASGKPVITPDTVSAISPSHAAVQKFAKLIHHYREALLGQEAQLRKDSSATKKTALQQGADALLDQAGKHVDHCREALNDFERHSPDDNDFRMHLKTVTNLVAAQAKIAQEAKDVMEHLNIEDHAAATERILGFVYQLLAASDRLRDALQSALVGIARAEKAVADYAKVVGADSPSGALSPVGFEASLLDWWKKDPHRNRPMVLAGWDIDDMSRLNRQHGCRAMDRVIRALAHWLSAELGEEVSLARLSGTRLATFRTDEEAAAMSDRLERLRQTIELLRFQGDGEEIRLTVSCALAEVTPQDTIPVILDRLNAVLVEARRSGGNRTFQYVRGKSAPVMPPNLSLPEQTIHL
ncbi:MAG: GGDEF domain-containing protein [Pirellulales bacterium]|nr:GGDEF domain-containing protein [Pirellulales bacterium]